MNTRVVFVTERALLNKLWIDVGGGIRIGLEQLLLIQEPVKERELSQG